ncbi:ORC ubiquitin ligase 1 [Bufo gargarizans]|uniref:ORC ubiquitin ligase 1 n=1 Tax=Bufo gargarizans TaxID=30331 RepID=UPI001CF4CA61|nr:ORC ubiquitin ligase 1 [Bufo gargarizans]
MAHNVQNVTLALTLPITCHICLGKVRQPVICANYHVFCSVCIDLWLKNNSQCPACRVPITRENPCRNIIGGTSEDEGTLTHSGRMHLRKTRLELLQKEYEEEIESLLKETEELKRANLQLEERLSRASDPAADSISCNCGKKEAEGGRGIREGLLEEWSRKLEMVNTANKKVVEDTEKLKEENRKLRNENIQCARENLRLKNEVDLRSPQKFGRFTVAALQAKVDQYEREMSRLKKALERSDQYIEELETQVEQLKKPLEDTQKEKSQCGNPTYVHVTDSTTTHTCQELNATQQLSSHSHQTGECSEEFSSTCSNSNGHSFRLNKLKSLDEKEGSPELKSAFSRYSSASLNSSEQTSIDSKSQKAGRDLAQGFGSPSSSLPFSSLHLNTPDSKANCSSSHGHLKKPLTYLRKLMFDDLPKRNEVCNSNSSISEKHLSTGEGPAWFREPKPSFFCQNYSESGDSKLPGQNNYLQLGNPNDSARDHREGLQETNQSRTLVENSMDKHCHDTVNELNTVMCNGRSQHSYHGNASSGSGTNLDFPSDSTVKVGKSSGDTASSHLGVEPILSASFPPCSLFAVRDGKDSPDKNFHGHLPCEPSLQSKEELIFHSGSVEAECTGHGSKSTWLSYCNPQTYSYSPPAKRKLQNQSSDSPTKSAKS